jgi:hypothetical protein
MALNLLKRDDQATAFGSESIAYLALCDLTDLPSGATEKTIASTDWKKFLCVIEQKLDMEPKTGELIDDRGRVVYSYSNPSKVKYSASIFQRDENTFEFLRSHASDTFAMWVVVGQIGKKNQEILMYGKLGGNYSEDMNADPKIPIEFNCEVNPVKIIANQPDEDTCFAESITLTANQMVVKKDS